MNSYIFKWPLLQLTTTRATKLLSCATIQLQIYYLHIIPITIIIITSTQFLLLCPFHQKDHKKTKKEKNILWSVLFIVCCYIIHIPSRGSWHYYLPTTNTLTLATWLNGHHLLCILSSCIFIYIILSSILHYHHLNFCTPLLYIVNCTRTILQ